MLPSLNPAFMILGSILILFLIIFGFPHIRNYINRRRRMELIVDQYENLRNTRVDLKHHYYWAIDKGERKQAESLEEEICKIEDKLEDLLEQYESLKKGKTVPLKKL